MARVFFTWSLSWRFRWCYARSLMQKVFDYFKNIIVNSNVYANTRKLFVFFSSLWTYFALSVVAQTAYFFYMLLKSLSISNSKSGVISGQRKWHTTVYLLQRAPLIGECILPALAKFPSCHRLTMWIFVWMCARAKSRIIIVVHTYKHMDTHACIIIRRIHICTTRALELLITTHYVT